MRQIAKPELDQILQQHKLWLKTGYVKGDRAHLEDADLRGVNLLGVDLRGADLLRADLRGVNLRDADLRGADLWYADLRGAQFDVNIRHCLGFQRAKFTADALPWLILHPKWSVWKDAVRIEAKV